VASSEIVHVIDDDAEVRQSLAFLLSTVGLAVRVHASATAFLETLANVQDGCIVTDVRMPGVDGIELQRRLKSMGVALPVHVVVPSITVRGIVNMTAVAAVDAQVAAVQGLEAARP